MIVVGLLISLAVPLVVLGLIARFVVGRIRSSDAPVSRVVGALVEIGVVVAAVNSVADLIELALPGREIFEDTTRLVAFDIATLVVAVPVAYAVWRSLFADTFDFSRRLTVVGSLSVFLVTTLTSTVNWGRSLFGEAGFETGALATTIAFGAAWLGAERMLWGEQGSFEVTDLRPTAGSGTGLALCIGALVLIIETALTEVLGVGGTVILERSMGERLATVGVLAVVGAPTLWWFWFADLRRRETRFRNGYAAVIAYGGLVVAVGSAASIAFLGLEWAFGLAAEPAPLHFEGLPVAVAFAVVAAAVWSHHIEPIRHRRGLARRAFGYAVAATGLSALAGGVATLIAVALEAISADTIVEQTDRSGSVALGGVVAAIAGSALWWVEWRRSDAQSVEERRSTPRRLYLSGLLVLFGLVGGVSLVVALFGFLRAVLEGSIGLDTVFEGRVVISLVVVTAPIVRHLIGELASDRERRAPELTRRDALLVAGRRGALSEREITFVARADGSGDISVEMAAAIDRVLAEPGPPVVITVSDGTFEVIEVTALP